MRLHSDSSDFQQKRQSNLNNKTNWIYKAQPPPPQTRGSAQCDKENTLMKTTLVKAKGEGRASCRQALAET